MIDALSILSITLLTLLGASIGSFGNVVAYRLPHRKSLTQPPSSCPTCHTRLTPLDLIPIISWLALRGRCRHCRTPISPRYLLVELGFAATFLLLALATQPSLDEPLQLLRFTLQAAALSLILIGALIDLEHKILPDTLTYSALTLALTATLLPSNWNALEHLSVSASDAWRVAFMASGALLLTERIFALYLRRGRDTRERPHPVSFDHALTALLAGVWLGPGAALALTLAHVIAGLAAPGRVRLPEPLMLIAITLSLGFKLLNDPSAIAGGFLAAGLATIALGIVWWVIEARHERRARAPLETPNEAPAEEGDPVAIGFGDIKLIAVLGALLPNAAMLLIGYFIANALGLLLALALRARQLPFGPPLILGVIIAAGIAPSILSLYTLTP